jgi:hypothetical protein
MRRETRKIMTAFLAGTPARADRTHTDGASVYLHRNRIAWREANGDVCMTLAGFGTVTTRERLNGLCDLLMCKRPFHQKKHVQYFDDMEIDTLQVISVHNIIPVTMDFAA